jgi:hypothetical protein
LNLAKEQNVSNSLNVVANVFCWKWVFPWKAVKKLLGLFGVNCQKCEI